MRECPPASSDEDVDEIDVLVVAPDPLLRHRFSDVLTSHGYRVDEVDDPSAAFERACTRSVGAMVLGVVGPEFDFLRAVHGRASPPIVMFRTDQPERTLRPMDDAASGEEDIAVDAMSVLFHVETALAAGGWQRLRDRQRPLTPMDFSV